MTTNDSKEQRQQEQANQNQTRTPSEANGVDKKLDGPNRPSV